MAVRAISNDGSSVCLSDTIWKELLELAAVFFGATVDSGRRRHRDEAVAVLCNVTITERGGEIDTLGSDVLSVAVLSVEVEDVFDGPEVAGFVVVSGGIFDVVKIELVFTGGFDSCSSIGTSSLETLVTVAVGVFLATERLDAARIEALDGINEYDEI